MDDILLFFKKTIINNGLIFIYYYINMSSEQSKKILKVFDLKANVKVLNFQKKGLEAIIRQSKSLSVGEISVKEFQLKNASNKFKADLNKLKTKARSKLKQANGNGEMKSIQSAFAKQLKVSASDITGN